MGSTLLSTAHHDSHTSDTVPVDTTSWISGMSLCFFGAPASRRPPSNEIALPNISDRSESSLIASNSTANPTFELAMANQVRNCDGIFYGLKECCSETITAYRGKRCIYSGLRVVRSLQFSLQVLQDSKASKTQVGPEFILL